MVDPTYPLFPVLAATSLILVLLPSPWHFNRKCSSTLIYICWTVIGLVIFLVDSVVWSGSVGNVAPVWCDITTKLQAGLGVAVSCCSLCLFRRLYYVSKVKRIHISQNDIRKTMIGDLCVGVLIPVLSMGFVALNQGHRFDILENIGCSPNYYPSPIAIGTVTIWPTLISSVSFIYAVRTLHAFIIQRAKFNEVLQSHSQGFKPNSYFRIMALATCNIICIMPLTMFVLVLNLKSTRPWRSWADTRWGYSEIWIFSYDELRQSYPNFVAFHITRFSIVFNGYVFFACFGVSGESGAFYRGLVRVAMRHLGRGQPTTDTNSPRIYHPNTTTTASFDFAAATSTNRTSCELDLETGSKSDIKMDHTPTMSLTQEKSNSLSDLNNARIVEV